MLKKLPPYLLAILVLFHSSCKDTFEPEGIVTTVYGRAYDWQNRLPVTGQLLILIESNKKPIAAPPGSTLTDIRHLDSAYTDEEGNYEITFITTGRGDTYHIHPVRSDSVWTFHGQEEIKPLGTSKEINFQYLHLYPATLLPCGLGSTTMWGICPSGSGITGH